MNEMQVWTTLERVHVHAVCPVVAFCLMLFFAQGHTLTHNELDQLWNLLGCHWSSYLQSSTLVAVRAGGSG